MKTSIKGPCLKKKRNVRSCYAQRANTSTSCEFRKDNYLRNYSRDPPPYFQLSRSSEMKFDLAGIPARARPGKYAWKGYKSVEWSASVAHPPLCHRVLIFRRLHAARAKSLERRADVSLTGIFQPDVRAVPSHFRPRPTFQRRNTRRIFVCAPRVYSINVQR